MQELPLQPASTQQPEFELLTPMLVMPFSVWRQQGRICKSTAEWREEAFRRSWLVEATAQHICVFVSHRWWHSPPGRPDGAYDWGGPDYVDGEKANLKWRLVCQGRLRPLTARPPRLSTPPVHLRRRRGPRRQGRAGSRQGGDLDRLAGRACVLSPRLAAPS